MRRRIPGTRTRPTQDDVSLQELNGLCEMGMHGEVLQMVDLLLSQNITSRLLNECIRALLAHADNLDEWVEKIEAAHTAMSLRRSRACRTMMLCFYHSIRNYQKALEFIPARFSRIAPAFELAFALDTFLALRCFKKADALVSRCLRLPRRTGRTEEANILLRSLADHFAHRRDWENVIMLWMEIISDDVLGTQAFVEIATARTEQARQSIKDGLAHIKHLRESAADDLAVSLPGNLKARLDEAEMELFLLKANLDQCFPEQ